MWDAFRRWLCKDIIEKQEKEHFHAIQKMKQWFEYERFQSKWDEKQGQVQSDVKSTESMEAYQRWVDRQAARAKTITPIPPPQKDDVMSNIS